MEQSGFVTEIFAQLFWKSSFFEVLAFLLLLSIGAFLFFKKKRKFVVFIAVTLIILSLDIIHTGISVWKASIILLDRNDSNISFYPSIYRDKIIREENYSIDTVYSYYLNLYGIGPKESMSFIRNVSFINKFTSTYLISFRVEKTPVRLRQYYYIKQKQYPYYLRYTDTDLVMATFKDRRLEFKIYTNNLYSQEVYLQAISHLKSWVNNADILDISIVMEKYSAAPVVNAQVGVLLNDDNALRDLTVNTLVRLGEK